MEADKIPDLIPADLRRIIDKLESDCNAITAPFRTKVYQRAAPELIYHYTDGDGLTGILQSRKLWLTDLFDLNDPSELRYGIRYAQDALDTISTDRGIEQFAKDFRKFTADGIQAIAHFFVGCFSCNGDELGQWRAYADDGRGFAIGFDSASLVGAFENSGKKIDVARGAFRLNYDGTELQSAQHELAKLLPAPLSALRGKQLARQEVAAYLTMLSSLFSMAAIEMAVLSKHRGYSSEDEYRFSDVSKIGRRDDVLYR